MSDLAPIPEEDLAWDYYYRLYYDDDDDDFQNSIYTSPRMDDYDPTKENENSALDRALDNDDDDTTAPGTPGTPGATSTPYHPGAAYHPGEEHELSTLPQEQSGVVHGPGEPAWKALTYIQMQVRRIWKPFIPRTHKGSRSKWPAVAKPHTFFLQQNGELA